MYKILYLLIIATLGASFNYISHPKLTEYSHSIFKIDSLSKSVNKKVKNINFGGCGYFAYYLTDLLDSIGLEYEISTINIEHEKKQITHVLIYLPDYNLFLDSRGIYKGINVNGNKYFYCLPINKFISKSELRKELSAQKWNKKFNIKDTIQLRLNLRF
jgi:hypothetical protein